MMDMARQGQHRVPAWSLLESSGGSQIPASVARRLTSAGLTGPVILGRAGRTPLPSCSQILQQFRLHHRLVSQMLDRSDDLLDVIGGPV